METKQEVPAGKEQNITGSRRSAIQVATDLYDVIKSNGHQEVVFQPLTSLEKGMGWQRDLPDFRDYTIDYNTISVDQKKRGIDRPVKKLTEQVNITPKASIAKKVDLRNWFAPIEVEDQGSIGSCTANAGVSLYEYFEQRAFGRHINASRLFLYKATRNLLKWSGDTGAYLRSTMGAMALFGVPPEDYWPYNIRNFDSEPSAFCYAFAQNYQAIQYFRLDPVGISRKDLLDRIKRCLTYGVPSMFGFTVYESISQARDSGHIPMPAPRERIRGGHAVVAVGYDDKFVIRNTNPNGPKTTGAFIVRNSWGSSFGDDGYCYIPYEYVLKGLAVDWWSLLKGEWVDTKNFGR